MTLGPLPPTFAATVASLHAVAEQTVSPARTDGHIWLQATPGGFGTPGGEARVDGADLVLDAGDGERREPLDVDPAAAGALAAWYALGDDVLARLIAQAGRGDDPSPVRLWPEHFDIAIELGSEAAGARANYGFSPGDDEHPEPYAYVGPWSGGLTELSYAELRAAADPAGAALAFFTANRGDNGNGRIEWYRVLAAAELPEGRVTTVAAGHKSVALVHYDGRYSALDNHCPHQGGPLGEGSIENGLLRCPWHGFDYCPLDGTSPGFDDTATTYALEIRDGDVWVGVEEERHVETVTDLMARTMVNWGVRHVFGMVGHSNLGLADALRRREEAGELTYIGIRHEGAAAFAASAYGKLTGRPAACLTIAGPGATNLLTGLWDAKVDRAPVLALTGQVDTQVLGPGAFQEVDLAGAFGSVAAWSQPVLRDSKPAELMNLACKSALLQRSVSHLIFPDEVQTLPAAEGAEPGGPQGRITPQDIAPPEESVAQALELLRGAERPVMIVGHGARFHMPAVIALAEQLGAPVITTFKAKGQIGDDHPLAAGVLGRSGTPVASWIMNEADLLLVLGASFSNHTGIYPGHPIIQVDFDAMQLGKFHPVACPVWGEIGIVVERLRRDLPPEPARADQAAQLVERWAIWRAEKASRAGDDRGHGVNSASVFAAMERHVPDDAVIAVDVGNHAYSFGRYFECRRHTVLMSGYLGSIGFGYPAAMGAWAAAPDRAIVAVTGDGGFAQYMAEVTTAVKHGMNITHVLLNNGQLGKIAKEQRAGEWDVWQTTLHNPNFSEYAANCGALGIRVTRRDELDDALARAVAHDGPAMVEVMTDAELV